MNTTAAEAASASEAAVATEAAARQRAERELERQQSVVSSMEEEASELAVKVRATFVIDSGLFG